MTPPTHTESVMTKTLLITGASSGIGRATALTFQSNGWNVIATMRRPEEETLLNTLDRVCVVRLDVNDPESIQEAIHEGLKTFGQIDAVLNNAGYGAYGPLEAFPAEAIERVFRTNVLGLISVTQAVLPLFRAQGGGLVMNVSSVGGRMSFPLGSLYHGTKFAVEGFSEALRFEMRAFNGQVKIIEPGFVKTNFGGKGFDFRMDPALGEYGPVLSAFQGGMASWNARASTAEVIAEGIYAAATDGTDTLRYPLGMDAVDELGELNASGSARYLRKMDVAFTS